MPLEKTSRWPRLLSQRGRNESSATKLVRKGKPLKLVLPPVNKIGDGPGLDQEEQNVAHRGKTRRSASASWATTVGTPLV